MSSLSLAGDTSGNITVSAPAVAGTNTLTLQAATATNSVNTLATAVASTSGTSIDFTSLPSWIKRITVMVNAVSTNSTSILQIQLGVNNSAETTGYSTMSGIVTTTNNTTRSQVSSAGFVFNNGSSAASSYFGSFIFTAMGSNMWSGIGNIYDVAGSCSVIAGGKTLAGTLNMIRLTTVNGTDTFDAGTINILYEG